MSDEAPLPEGPDDVESRLFIPESGIDLVRRAGDATLIVVGLLLFVVNGWIARRRYAYQEAVGDLIDSIPSWINETFAWMFTFGALFVIWLLLAAVVRRHPRWDVAARIVVSIGIAIGLALVISRVLNGQWPEVLPEIGRGADTSSFPIVRVAALAAAVSAVGPHLVRPVRHLGWILVGLVALAGVGIGLGLPSDALGGIGLGFVAGGTLLTFLGSPAGYPTAERLRTDLAGFGANVGDLALASTQGWGARAFTGTDSSGRPLHIKIYGRDARDAQFFVKAWRFVWYKDAGPIFTISRLQQVEHEALTTVMARDADVSTRSVKFAAVSPNDDAILVTGGTGIPLTELDAGSVSDDAFIALWREVGKLHEAGIAHGSLRADHVAFDGETPVLIEFSSGSLFATDRDFGSDVAELLVSLADVMGVERAVDTAARGLGDARLADALGYLQMPAISSQTRKTLEKPKALIQEVSDAVAHATGVEAPERVELRRVSARNLVTLGLLAFAVYFMIQQLAGVDFASTWDTIRNGNWTLVLIGLIVAQVILVPNATALIAAVSAPIPLRPTIVLQSAIQFIGLAVPSAAGRIATNVAYLTKFGVSAVTSVTQGALDSFTGFIVQVVILVLAFAVGDVSFTFSNDSTINVEAVLIIGGIILGGIIVVLVVEKWRTKVFEVLREAVGSLSDLFHEPRRAMALFGSNLGSQVVLAMTLSVMVLAYGPGISMATSLVVVVAASLLGGLAPTPGGMGVQEAVIAGALIAAGVDSSVAYPATIMYRIVTFFLPPTWGYGSLRWLESNGYI